MTNYEPTSGSTTSPCGVGSCRRSWKRSEARRGSSFGRGGNAGVRGNTRFVRRVRPFGVRASTKHRSPVFVVERSLEARNVDLDRHRRCRLRRVRSLQLAKRCPRGEREHKDILLFSAAIVLIMHAKVAVDGTINHSQPFWVCDREFKTPDQYHEHQKAWEKRLCHI